MPAVSFGSVNKVNRRFLIGQSATRRDFGTGLDHLLDCLHAFLSIYTLPPYSASLYSTYKVSCYRMRPCTYVVFVALQLASRACPSHRLARRDIGIGLVGLLVIRPCLSDVVDHVVFSDISGR
jgi:hypothetical protein